MKTIGNLLDEVRERVGNLGFDLIDLRKKGSSRRMGMEIRIDRIDPGPGEGITVDECAAVSRALEEWLDAAGVLGPNYVLEVSSPGIERPVRWPRHWEQHVGKMVKVKLPGIGRRKAKIVSVDGNRVTLLPETSGDGGGEELTVEITDDLKASLAVDWNEL